MDRDELRHVTRSAPTTLRQPPAVTRAEYDHGAAQTVRCEGRLDRDLPLLSAFVRRGGAARRLVRQRTTLRLPRHRW